MDKEKIDTFLMLIKHEMMVEQRETVNQDFIKQIILRAGGNQNDFDDVIRHSVIKEIDNDLYYVNTSD